MPLGPGDEQTITIPTTSASFATQGNLALMLIATSQANPAVQTSASAIALTIPATTGLTAAFSPNVQLLPIPGSTSFLLQVTNTGNSQDSYSATITGTSGPVTASLMGLNGQPTQTIPSFILPALSTGAIVVQSGLSAAGTGAVTVQVQSMSQPAREPRRVKRD